MANPDRLTRPHRPPQKSLCINDDAVLCSSGNDVFLHACQGTDVHVHTANHFSFDARSARIVARFCTHNASTSGMCLGVLSNNGVVALAPCSDASATGWARKAVPLPPAPPPPPPFGPTPPPLPPQAPKCKDCPNIVFFLTDDQDILLGGALPAASPGGATPLPRTKELLFDKGAHATNFFIHTPICCAPLR